MLPGHLATASVISLLLFATTYVMDVQNVYELVYTLISISHFDPAEVINSIFSANEVDPVADDALASVTMSLANMVSSH